MAVNIFPGPYNPPATTFHTRTAKYSRVVHVTGSLNNPLTLTGSYEGNTGFIILQPGSVALTFAGSTAGTFTSGQFHEIGGAHTIYELPLLYVSASNTGSLLVLY
jgi:hypothetical protein